jgi:hypothetical protein
MEKEKIEKLKDSVIALLDKNKKFYHEDLVEQAGNFWAIVFELNALVKNIYENIDVNVISDKQKCCLYVLTNCISDIIHSLECLRSGSIKGSSSLLRCAVEAISLIFAIHSDETDEIFEKYKNDQLNIPKMISISKKHFGELGQLYGILSNKLVHEPYDMIFRLLQKNPENKISINIIKEIDDSSLQECILLIHKTAMVSITLGRVFEWTFAKSIEPNYHYEVFEEVNLKQKKNESMKRLELIELCLRKLTDL